MNKNGRILMILFSMVPAVALLAIIALAAPLYTVPPQPSWFEHSDLMQIIISGLFIAVLWLLIQTLKKIDANQALLFKKVDELCAEFYELRGEHKAMKDRCGRE